MGSILETRLLTPGSGTHTLQADTYYVRVVCISGGGGGASGSSGSGYWGAGGGACGAVSDISMPVLNFGGAGAAVPYTVGAGGAGGAQLTADGVGNDGGTGLQSTFGVVESMEAGGGKGGTLVQPVDADMPTAPRGNLTFYDIPAASTPGISGDNKEKAGDIGNLITPTSGGAGDRNNGTNPEGSGGNYIKVGSGTILMAGGTGFPGPGLSGGNGTDFTATDYIAGGTGGGGGSRGDGTVSPGAGGNGGIPGGGGGGGGKRGPTDFGTVSGAGGNGGSGGIYVWEYRSSGGSKTTGLKVTKLTTIGTGNHTLDLNTDYVRVISLSNARATSTGFNNPLVWDITLPVCTLGGKGASVPYAVSGGDRYSIGASVTTNQFGSINDVNSVYTYGESSISLFQSGSSFSHDTYIRAMTSKGAEIGLAAFDSYTGASTTNRILGGIAGVGVDGNGGNGNDADLDVYIRCGTAGGGASASGTAGNGGNGGWPGGAGGRGGSTGSSGRPGSGALLIYEFTSV